MRKSFCLLLLFAGVGLAQAPASFVNTEVASVRKSPSDAAEQVTEALLDDELQVLEQRGDWFKVYVKPQYRTQKGYPGWIRRAHVSKDVAPSQERAVVTVAEANLREAPDAHAKIVQKAPLGASLVLVEPYHRDGWLSVWLAGRKQPLFVPGHQLSPGEREPQGADIVETALQLKGTKYVWGGMTSAGVDCSGLIYTAYRAHGITLPRDADQQFLVGEPVKVSDLQPGDLLFFGKSADDITHVGMFKGDGQFLHASSSLGGVTVTDLNHAKYSALFQGARRVLGSDKTLPTPDETVP